MGAAPLRAETFDSTDVGRVEAFVSSIYSKMHIGAVGEHTRARISRRVLGPDVGFDDLDYSFDIGYSADPPDKLIVCDVVTNTIRMDAEEAGHTFGPGDQFLISRPGLPYAGEAHASELRFAILAPAVLDRVAASTGDGPDGSVRILSHRPTSVQAQLRLQRTIAYVRDDMMAAPDGPAAALIASTASQYLAASVLQAYPNTATGSPRDSECRDANPSTVRRAVAFIDGNADLDISLADIAQAACVTPRALQLAFRRHLDTTPLCYLRSVRLAHAPAELRSATAGDGNTVTDIAARWGFTISHFTPRYRATYGELPSQTLHG